MTTSSTKSNTAGKQKQQRSKASEEKPKATRQDAYSILKAEIARVSRKQSKTDNDALKRSSAQYRSDIAALKRRVLDLERLITKLAKRDTLARPASGRTSPGGSPDRGEDADEKGYRWRPDGFKKLRATLGISAAEMGKLIGCSNQSVYKWEDGKARPRARQLPAIAAVRMMGKRGALARLAEIDGAAPAQ